VRPARPGGGAVKSKIFGGRTVKGGTADKGGNDKGGGGRGGDGDGVGNVGGGRRRSSSSGTTRATRTAYTTRTGSAGTSTHD